MSAERPSPEMVDEAELSVVDKKGQADAESEGLVSEFRNLNRSERARMFADLINTRDTAQDPNKAEAAEQHLAVLAQVTYTEEFNVGADRVSNAGDANQIARDMARLRDAVEATDYRRLSERQIAHERRTIPERIMILDEIIPGLPAHVADEAKSLRAALEERQTHLEKAAPAEDQK